ncbi:hypothetical protein B0T14DRAFT_567824 [Immersiella caudata]|uniref:Uncharacterized protein n=1 Tax=Immersiella caudata TaxID=314043 RepID=A0AA40BWI4_9PEZI|nr:hypothetical protein B0T14DRAFT_567824 [Immersiella caudata]
MAEAIALAANVMAVIQLAERVASICKFYMGEVDNYQQGLRLIYVEIASLKVVFEGLSFLDEDEKEKSATLQALRGEDGPFRGCEKALEKLKEFFPPFPLEESLSHQKDGKFRIALARLAWPMKASSATRFLEEITWLISERITCVISERRI